jgi:hypothetical protein
VVAPYGHFRIRMRISTGNPPTVRQTLLREKGD